MSSGMPVLSTFEGGIPDIIDDGINGNLFYSSDIHELCSLMAYYIDNPIEVAAQGKNANMKYNEKYTEEIFETNIIATLKKLMK